jgi:hypothetical protein
VAHLKEMKSLSFINVMTRFASSFGTGNNALKIPMTLSPSCVLNPSKIKCGNCSLTVLVACDETSCRKTTLCRVIDRVGPCGRCEMMSASGTPRCSCTRMRSVMLLERQAGMRSDMVVFPRFRRWALGKTRRISLYCQMKTPVGTTEIQAELTLANCNKRDEGDREVVTTILGSYVPTLAYSSSI